ncbi:MAG: hypothetical protein AAF633_06990 [Chloroflexota bacterium]
MSRIDRSKMTIAKEGFRFEPFRPTERHISRLADAKLKPNTELIAFERGGERRVVLISESIYHHIIQGELADEPYMVTY